MADSTKLVAIVDDEESVRRALSRLVRIAGFEVDCHASGVEFLQSLEHRHPDCVVLDLRMPHVKGLDVQEALKTSAPNLPVVILTADDSERSRARALAAGARFYLRKPVEAATLMDAIASALGPP
jgi:FixJ family two-component response regulator